MLKKLQAMGYVGEIFQNPQYGEIEHAPRWKAKKTPKGWKAEDKAVQEKSRKYGESERKSRQESRTQQFEEGERARLRRALRDV